MKKILSFGLLFFALPLQTFAHVKWFVTPTIVPESSLIEKVTEQVPMQTLPSTFSPEVGVWAFITVLLIVIALLLDFIPSKIAIHINKFSAKNTVLIHRIFQILIGISLLISSLQGRIIAPHTAVPGAFGTGLTLLQGVIAVLLLAGFQSWIAGILLCSLTITLIPFFGFLTFLEYCNVFALGAYLFVTSSPFESVKQLRPYGLPMLRIVTGIALIVLAWSEKINNPSLSVELLRQYNFNFMPALGFSWFSNPLFIFSAGVMEAVFGILLVLGSITRINTLVLAIFLLSTNGYFFVSGYASAGTMELIGHLPVIATAILFVCFGAGEKYRINTILKKFVSFLHT